MIIRIKRRDLNLAGAVLDVDVAVFADGTGLLRVGFGGSGVGLGLEMVLLVRHGGGYWRRLMDLEKMKSRERSYQNENEGFGYLGFCFRFISVICVRWTLNDTTGLWPNKRFESLLFFLPKMYKKKKRNK